jgi:hypothetical protein
MGMITTTASPEVFWLDRRRTDASAKLPEFSDTDGVSQRVECAEKGVVSFGAM